jgi:NNP family nitrate/nitrite transporter-like MFS transporter
VDDVRRDRDSIRETLNLNNTEFGLLTATPVLLGAVMRLPLGIWTDRLGGRIVMTVLLLAAAVPVYAAGYLTEYWQFLAVGFVLASSAHRLPSARRTAPASSRPSGADSRWASLAPARWVRRSTCSLRRG